MRTPHAIHLENSTFQRKGLAITCAGRRVRLSPGLQFWRRGCRLPQHRFVSARNHFERSIHNEFESEINALLQFREFRASCRAGCQFAPSGTRGRTDRVIRCHDFPGEAQTSSVFQPFRRSLRRHRLKRPSERSQSLLPPHSERGHKHTDIPSPNRTGRTNPNRDRTSPSPSRHRSTRRHKSHHAQQIRPPSAPMHLARGKKRQQGNRRYL